MVSYKSLWEEEKEKNKQLNLQAFLLTEQVQGLKTELYKSEDKVQALEELLSNERSFWKEQVDSTLSALKSSSENKATMESFAEEFQEEEGSDEDASNRSKEIQKIWEELFDSPLCGIVEKKQPEGEVDGRS